VHWSRGLAKERSRRKLGTWRNFWYGGFGSYGEEFTNRAGERELLQTPFMANRERRGRGRRVAEESEAGGELGRGAWSTWRRHRPGKRDRPPRRQRTEAVSFGRRRPPLLRTVRHREKYGRGNDRWGPRVRNFFYLNSNFWDCYNPSP